jgi:hypothetical protein
MSNSRVKRGKQVVDQFQYQWVADGRLMALRLRATNYPTASLFGSRVNGLLPHTRKCPHGSVVEPRQRAMQFSLKTVT